MRTQKHDLKEEIKHLEYDLYRPDQDAKTVLAITEKLDILKSTLYNIQ
tara:strand:+ start:326 stop:469 length:144 start_codon:yes stop_codon:yes gene_type:complete